jgi:trans-2,3-dihydro-3-hydroxyanthranilate isomerase
MKYLHYDVFTDRRFEGNQLAVFPDASGLSDAMMQTIAREMNFSESTFIMPPEAAGTDVRMRIFTPGLELPMAGHPTIGSTFALAELGVIAPGRERWVFGLNVGPTPVELTWTGRRLGFAWMDQQRPDFRTPLTPADDITRAIGVSMEMVPDGLPIEEISCGANFIFVPLKTRAAVDAAEPDTARIKQLTSAFPSGRVAVFLFSAEPVDADVTVYSRMFAPGFGITEDPATGGASGPLGSYLVKHGLVPHTGVSEMISLQGVKIGRPSRIHIRIASDARRTITRVQVGGTAVRVARGELELESKYEVE